MSQITLNFCRNTWMHNLFLDTRMCPGVWVILVALIWLLCCPQLLFSWMVLNIQGPGLHSWALPAPAEADHSAKLDCLAGPDKELPHVRPIESVELNWNGLLEARLCLLLPAFSGMENHKQTGVLQGRGCAALILETNQTPPPSKSWPFILIYSFIHPLTSIFLLCQTFS